MFDVAICLIAAFDILQKRRAPPTDLELARREGWIWVAVGADSERLGRQTK